MRVLQIHNRSLRPGGERNPDHKAGGAEAVIENDRVMLLESGHQVDQFIVDNRETLRQASRLRAGLDSIWNRSVAARLQNTLATFEPDVVHVHTPFPLVSPVVFRVGARSGAATVATAHSFRYSCVQANLYRGGRLCELCVGRKVKTPGVIHRCYHDSLLASAALTTSLALHRSLGTFDRDVDGWITPSSVLKDTLAREGIPASRITVRPHAVKDPGDGGQRSDHALYLGRLEPVKGVMVLLRAWESMTDPPKLVILGDGSLRDAVERSAARHPAIEFRGWADQRTVRAELAAARFLVLPSEWYEAGVPVAAVQAFAAGTPIIASDVGNFSDVIRPGVNGFLFRCGDSESLGAAVRQGWERSASWPELHRGARQTYLDHHCEERSRDTLMTVYDEAMARRAAKTTRRAGVVHDRR
jgi:glycosyltransferase involved in cell wall biosynthesis